MEPEEHTAATTCAACLYPENTMAVLFTKVNWSL